jgi:hypothetical protein
LLARITPTRYGQAETNELDLFTFAACAAVFLFRGVWC